MSHDYVHFEPCVSDGLRDVIHCIREVHVATNFASLLDRSPIAHVYWGHIWRAGILWNHLLILNAFPNVNTSLDKRTAVFFPFWGSLLCVSQFGSHERFLLQQERCLKPLSKLQRCLPRDSLFPRSSLLFPPHHFRLHVSSKHSHDLLRA